MSIGENLKKIRKEKKLTQQKLAEEMNISRSYLSDIENNRKNPSSKTLDSLAEKLNVSMLYLTTGKKTLNDLSNTEINDRFSSVTSAINKQQEYLQSDLASNFQEPLNSELSLVETIYLISAINFLKGSSSEDVIVLTDILGNINRSLGNEEDFTQEELLEFIEEETKKFKELIKGIYKYHGEIGD